ncbi:MAG: replication factor C small subunit [Thermoplasmata archaeon]
MKEVWVEKHRPKSLDDVVGQEEVVERLKAYVKTRNLPHLLFAGPAGTGKTTCAIALTHELFGDNWQLNFNELNASDERGIDVVRTKIKNFARMAPIGEGGFKIIFLDEADALTADAQAALRRTMEKYTGTCRFILSVNYSSKVIEPIQSRCAVFRFRPLKPEAVAKYLSRIAKVEKIEITEKGMEALIYIAQGDLRKATNALQVAASINKKVDEDTLYRAAATARPKDVRELLEISLEGDFMAARSVLDDLLIEYGLSGEDVIKQIHRTLFELAIPDEVRVKLIDKIGEVEFRIIEGSNERIQLENLISNFVIAGLEMRKK